MGANEKFCLRWNDFESNISLAFREIREEKDFFDCTLSCGSRQIQAHKLILSACSPFFRSILRQNPHQHPLLYLKGVEFTDLQAVLNFMYHGEVNVAQEELNSFLAVAEDLKIKGLTQNNSAEPKPKSTMKTKPVKVKENFPTPILTAASHTPLPSNQYQQHDDDIQEVLPVVKTEPVHHSQQPQALNHLPVHQQPQQVSHPPVSYATPGVEQVQVDTQVASMEEGYVEEEGYDYAGYEGEGSASGYDGFEGYDEGGLETGVADTNKEFETESLIQYANGQYECGMCGKGFPLKITCRRHVQNVHSNNQKVLCHVCNKYMKNSGTLKAHLRGSHGIYQGGKSK